MAHKLANGLQVSNSNYQRNCGIAKEKLNEKDKMILDKDDVKAGQRKEVFSKRPELQIYRPGMGLRQKNNLKPGEEMPDGEENLDSKNDNNSYSSGASDVNKSDPVSIAKEIDELHLNDPHNSPASNDGRESGSRRSRHRRPDKQVYVPKPKIAALSNSPVPPNEKEENANSSQKLNDNREEDSRQSPEYNTYLVKTPIKTFESIKVIESIENVDSKNNLSQMTRSSLKAVVNGDNSSPPGHQEQINVNDNNLHNVNQFNKRNFVRNENQQINGKRVETVRDHNNGESNGGNRAPAGGGNNGGKKKSARKIRERRNDEIGRNRRSSQDWDVEVIPAIPAALETTLLTNRTFSQEDVYSNVTTNDLKTAVRSCESPFKNAPTVINSPKGRGRSKAINFHATEKLLIPNDSIHSSFETFEKVPTLIYERSRKIDEPVGDNYFERFSKISTDIPSDSRWQKKHEPVSKVPMKSNKDLPRFRGVPNETMPARDTRDLSEFQQNPPPRFQRHNLKDLNKQSVTFMTEELALEKAESKNAGILRIPNWDSGQHMTTTDVHNNGPPSSLPIQWNDYGHSQNIHHYMQTKQLYDPMSIEKQQQQAAQSSPCPPQPSIHQFHPNFMPHNTVPNHFPINSVQSCRIPNMSSYMEQYTSMHPQTRQQCPPGGYMPYGLGHNGFSPMHPQANATPTPPPSSMIQQSFSDQLMHPNNANPPKRDNRVKPIVEKNIHDAGLLERELNAYITKGLENADTKALGQCRWKLQLRYENVILADPRFCADRNVENALWKSAFHQVIEAYRRLKDQLPTKQDETNKVVINSVEETNKAIINLVEEGTVFYESLLEKQQETFGINLSQFVDTDFAKPKEISPEFKVILLSAQKIYICLGDLARYREQAANTTSYGKARSWYLKAQQIAPKNGRPYNQLAILAIYARRKLDAVYYYMRSLAASNPFLSARESLLSLFDEARRKYEATEKKRLEEKLAKSKESDKTSSLHKFEDRIEIWISPNGCSRQHSSSSKDDLLNQLTSVELNKRFVLSFLHVHGKLFTKVGMELFTETTNQMLHEFRILLQCTPAPLSSARLLQLLAINMFAVANTAAKAGNPMEAYCRPLLQEQALQVSLAMVAIVIERCIVLFKEHISGPDFPAQLVSDDLTQLLPTLKVWTDWMACQRDLWFPLPSLGDLRTGCKGDIWTLYANLLNVLPKIRDRGFEIRSKTEPEDGYEAVTLPEDASLACFVPLLGAPGDTYYGVRPILDKERARILLRMIRIEFFGDYLTGIPTPYLNYNVEKQCFISLVMTPAEENTDSSPRTGGNSSDEDGTIEDGIEELEEDSPKWYSDDDTEIRKLWSRQEALKRTKENNDRSKAQIQEVLRENRTKRPMEIRIMPRYLIPDTNCFIDHLMNVRSLLKSSLFNLVVPLVVINELDGLARGVYDRPSSAGGNSWSAGSGSERSRQVGQAAKEAMHFLEERFAAREPKLRSITSKGSILDTISFRSEEYHENKGTNDDMILFCCQFYCKDKAEQFMPKDPNVPLQIHREVVLLTDDRNLRVKAISQNVPVQSIQDFLKWANIR